MTSTIPARAREVAALSKILDSEEPQMLAIYGRRRIGKTHLISQYFNDKGVYFELTGSDKLKTSEQIINFMAAMVETFPGSEKNVVPKNWTEAFHQLREQVALVSTAKKVILFFDELPWLAKPRSGFLAALEFFWNRYMSRRPNIIVVICGSAAAWMIEHVISDKGGLHGRVTKKIHLQPFNLQQTDEFLRAKNIKLTKKEIIEIYMAIGGVAKYWNEVEPGKSSAQIIDAACFNPNGALYDEFLMLYRSLFKSYEQHVKIVKVLAKSSGGLSKNELLVKSGLKSGGTTSKIIDELVQSDFIIYAVPFGNKSSKGRYILVDEYSLFYLRWIEPITKQGAARQDTNYWLKQKVLPKWSTWSGYAFEAICQKHIIQIKKALGVSAVSTTTSSWRYIPTSHSDFPGVQIDLIIDRADGCINLCEIKFYNKLFRIDKGYAQKLSQKKEIFLEQTATRKAVFITMLSSYGVDKNDYYQKTVDGGQITADDLFANIN